MAELRTEEEQIEAIKNWWADNGKTVLVGAVLVLASYFGVNTYKNHVRGQGEQASAIYQQALELVDQKGEAEQAKKAQLFNQLKTEFSSTPYAKFAALFLAKDAVEAADFAMAETELRYVQQNPVDEPMKMLATVRLAMVLNEEKKYDEALALVTGAAQYLEVKGDILFAQGKTDEARDAYQLAKAAVQLAGTSNPVLDMKLDNLAVAQ
jgi:predicted negative regulator of RcsB-dependent stress response